MANKKYSDELVRESIRFLKLLSKEFGDDSGTIAFKTICSSVDESLADQILLEMLRSDGSDEDNQVKLCGSKWPNVSSITEKIELIKELRHYTGMGLKDAKDVVDHIFLGKDVGISCKSAEAADSFKKSLKIKGLAGLI